MTTIGVNKKMMDTFDATLLSFVAVEGLFTLMGDPCAGFFPAVIAAVVGFHYAYKAKLAANEKRDNPPTESYDLPMPLVFSQIKKVLKIFRYGERRWNLAYIDPGKYSLNAISEWKEQTQDEDGPYFQQVFLDLSVSRSHEKELTDLTMTWTINAAGSRLECEYLQLYTTYAIRASLRQSEAARAASLVSSGCVPDDEDELE